MAFSRREFLKWSVGGAILATGLPRLANANVLPVGTCPNDPRSLSFYNLHTSERLSCRYFDGKEYVDNVLVELNHFCRDFRRNEVHVMDRKLFDLLYQIKLLLATDAEVELVSGYRSIATNNALRRHSSGVAKHSYHTKGQAIDFRLKGVALSDVHAAALALEQGGVGYYPRSNFVHIDTGPVRHWSQ
ncbi:DUF882 domain-containing protein [Vibrio sp. S4M6]|uniref:YcbK family protein n=1 Tax=Vibrio sinus TaxID=2946865 RepID=UPI00202A7219|nr:YcbK family protein [Vibrio sinus]MCL9781173.1 DUF882 domain-containing protein [Vibrio sinus]